MKYSIMGFNQEKIINNELDIDLIDLTLLDYVYTACARPSMIHTFDDNKQPYVWLKHSKILEDLPILRIGEEALKKRLKKLVDIGLLKVIVTSAESKGRRAYYTITIACEELRYNNQVYQNTLDTPRPSVSKYTSDNLLNNNNIIKTTTNVVVAENSASDDFLTSSIKNTPTKAKTKKPNLYTNCLNAIDEFTDNQEVKAKLIEYLKVRLERKDKPFGINTFKGMLNKLRTLTTSAEECLKIIQQSIDLQYPSFFELNSFKRTPKEYKCPEIISAGEKRSITDEEYEEAIKLGQKF